jgi:dCTP deaminase
LPDRAVDAPAAAHLAKVVDEFAAQGGQRSGGRHIKPFEFLVFSDISENQKNGRAFQRRWPAYNRPTIRSTCMSIKSDKWIRRMAEQHGMIEPFEPGQIRQNAAGQKIVSYGTSSYGYDIRCAPEFKVFTNIHSTVVDPKNFDENSFVDINKDVCVIPPNSFALARTVEYFRIPRNVLTICLGKSTYARCGIIVNVTPFEPEWEGYVTLEFSNTTPLPAKIYAGEGCAQVLFFESDEVCETSYKDRGGKYQGQVGVTLPKT